MNVPERLRNHLGHFLAIRSRNLTIRDPWIREDRSSTANLRALSANKSRSTWVLFKSDLIAILKPSEVASE